MEIQENLSPRPNLGHSLLLPTASWRFYFALEVTICDLKFLIFEVPIWHLKFKFIQGHKL